jgi:DNA-binding NtrC family response regulator
MTSANRVLAFSSPGSRFPDASPTEAPEALQILVGPSPAAAHLWEQIRRVAPHFRTALLTGEAGTGADAVARALHDLSPSPWRTFNTLAPAQAEEFFARRALHSAPVDGTLFLTGIERLSRQAQSGLLRILRHRGPHPLRLIVFASNGLRAAVSAGLFSSELASALTAVRIAIPALRERSQDIPMLLSHLLQHRAQALGKPAPPLTPAFLNAVTGYVWPGNLDQMATVLDHLVRNGNGDPLLASSLEEAIAESVQASPGAHPEARMVKLDQVIHEHIRSVLFGCNGNKLRAAEVLGISRSTLYRMLEASVQAEPLSLAG